MKAWVIPVILFATVAVLFVAGASVLRSTFRQEERIAQSLLSIRKEYLNSDLFRVHYQVHYRGGEPMQEPDLPEFESEMRGVLDAHPGARLFYFSSSDDAWKALGGQSGYAIHRGKKILWEVTLKVS